MRPWRCRGLCARAVLLFLCTAPLFTARAITGEEPGPWHLIAPQPEGPAAEPGSDLNASKDRKVETGAGKRTPLSLEGVPPRWKAALRLGRSASQLSGTPPSSGRSHLKRMSRRRGVPTRQGHQHLSGQIALDH